MFLSVYLLVSCTSKFKLAIPLTHFIYKVNGVRGSSNLSLTTVGLVIHCRGIYDSTDAASDVGSAESASDNIIVSIAVITSPAAVNLR